MKIHSTSHSHPIQKKSDFPKSTAITLRLSLHIKLQLILPGGTLTCKVCGRDKAKWFLYNANLQHAYVFNMSTPQVISRRPFRQEHCAGVKKNFDPG